MKTYYFTTDAGWIGGSGVVIAKNKKEALKLVNDVLANDPMTKTLLESEDELTEVVKNSAVLITNGNY